MNFDFEFESEEPDVIGLGKNAPGDFMVIMDHREVRGGWRMDGFGLVIEARHLKTGDYSIVNSLEMDMSGSMTIERKELSDAVGSMTNNRERFENEMVRCKEMIDAGGMAFVIIEGSLGELFSLFPLAANSVLSTWISWRKKYLVDFIWAGDRVYAQAIAVKIMDLMNRESIKMAFKKIMESKVQGLAAPTSDFLRGSLIKGLGPGRIFAISEKLPLLSDLAFAISEDRLRKIHGISASLSHQITKGMYFFLNGISHEGSVSKE